MSKVDELREKYRTVHESSFNKLNDGDTTPTKKYLEYMLRLWVCAKGNRNFNALQLVKEVMKFNELLPYHENKDIYSADYNYFNSLVEKNNKAEEIKEDKTFNREEHVDVIYEDDEIIFVSPKTHKGSIKYGSNTKWCTASKNSPQVFERYVKVGCLGYLIDKSDSKGKNHNKIAFYNSSSQPLSGIIDVYRQDDHLTYETQVVKNKWKPEKLAELMLRFRAYHMEKETINTTKLNVQHFIDVVKDINFDELHSNLQYLENRGKNDFKDIGDILNSFTVSLEKSAEKLGN